MNYRTIVASKDFDFEISHQSNLLLLGSCFSDNIGSKLLANKFNTLINPFGILFNPISIVNTLNDIIEEKDFGSEIYILKMVCTIVLRIIVVFQVQISMK